ncbi:MAG TPA: hypothetical protein VFA32_18515 [Dehalococcoidia bacterium]|nr:hypothetical protein [Dehalococcoidia bacterium]
MVSARMMQSGWINAILLSRSRPCNLLQVQNGYLEFPDGPGLGVELDEKIVTRLAGS